jgi:hypothetical protein
LSCWPQSALGVKAKRKILFWPGAAGSFRQPFQTMAARGVSAFWATRPIRIENPLREPIIWKILGSVKYRRSSKFLARKTPFLSHRPAGGAHHNRGRTFAKEFVRPLLAT